MKRLIFIVVIVFMEGCSYVVIKFLLLEMWVIECSEEELNEWIEDDERKEVDKIAKDKERYEFLKSIKKGDLENGRDKEGGGGIGYYGLDINKKPVGLRIN
ncbi:hypothetical protein, partial [Staphylococcus epidermidis]|uniref:hypothetical protein n=1 Tax=Staphylococcus epidermidis TaxID=1282 RepID=UPI0011A044B2